jgi:hypothetical protein
MGDDDTVYCDMNGHIYSHPDDVECANSYIKEIEELKALNHLLKEQYELVNSEYGRLLKRRNWDASERKKLKKQVEYWKNFALIYWSGDNLGEGDAGGCSVWQEALEEANMNDDYDREALTKKCMQCND